MATRQHQLNQEIQMMVPETFDSEADVQPMIAPEKLNSETRGEFRRCVLEALEHAERMEQNAVELDLSATTEMDASGLGVLILLQKRAREKGMAVRLLRVPGAVEQLLEATRLGSLFEIVRA
jgi:anti-anti-sigma factor